MKDLISLLLNNLLAKYTKKQKCIFIQNAANCLLYIHFYLTYGYIACFEQNDVDQNNFKSQMESLTTEGFENVFSSVKQYYEILYQDRVSKS